MSHNNYLPALKSCSCGSSNINSENWKDRRRIITCLACDRKVWANTNRQAINAWNKGRTGDCDDEPGPITIESLQDEIVRLRIENEALREALEKIADDCDAGEHTSIATEALALLPVEMKGEGETAWLKQLSPVLTKALNMAINNLPQRDMGTVDDEEVRIECREALRALGRMEDALLRAGKGEEPMVRAGSVDTRNPAPKPEGSSCETCGWNDEGECGAPPSDDICGVDEEPSQWTPAASGNELNTANERKEN